MTQICAGPDCRNPLPSRRRPGRPSKCCSPKCRARKSERNRAPRDRKTPPHPCGLCERTLTGTRLYCDDTCLRLARLRRELAARSLKLGRDEADLELAVDARLAEVA